MKEESMKQNAKVRSLINTIGMIETLVCMYDCGDYNKEDLIEAIRITLKESEEDMRRLNV